MRGINDRGKGAFFHIYHIRHVLYESSKERKLHLEAFLEMRFHLYKHKSLVCRERSRGLFRNVFPVHEDTRFLLEWRIQFINTSYFSQIFSELYRSWKSKDRQQNQETTSKEHSLNIFQGTNASLYAVDTSLALCLSPEERYSRADVISNYNFENDEQQKPRHLSSCIYWTIATYDKLTEHKDIMKQNGKIFYKACTK